MVHTAQLQNQELIKKNHAQHEETRKLLTDLLRGKEGGLIGSLNLPEIKL